MISIVSEESIKAGGYAPFQADFVDIDNYAYYARFRHGGFALKKSLRPTGEFAFESSETIFRKTYGSTGYVDYEELKRITSHFLVWPAEEGVLRICQKQVV